jgi:hypothetical protein
VKQTSFVIVILAAGLGVALGLGPRGNSGTPVGWVESSRPPETAPEPTPRPAPASSRPVGLEDSTHPTKPGSPPPAKPMQLPRMVGPDGTPIERAG